MNNSISRTQVSNCLMDEPPLVVSPTLATRIGLNEAIVVQQIHYWIEHNRRTQSERHFHRGRYWTYNTAEDWQAKNFPFWSVPTVRRIFNGLEKKGILLSGNFNSHPTDKTKWHTIDYEALNQALRVISPSDQSDQMEVINLISPIDQSDQTIRSNWVDDLYTERSTERSTETTTETSSSNQEPTTTAEQVGLVEPSPLDLHQIAATATQPPKPSLTVNPKPQTFAQSFSKSSGAYYKDATGKIQGNGTPWLPHGPWESLEEYQAFEKFLEVRLVNKTPRYRKAILERVGKGDEGNTVWQAFKAGEGAENPQQNEQVPQRWIDLLEQCIANCPAPDPKTKKLAGISAFRRQYTYSSTGQETLLGPEADRWAIAEKARVEAGG